MGAPYEQEAALRPCFDPCDTVVWNAQHPEDDDGRQFPCEVTHQVGAATRQTLRDKPHGELADKRYHGGDPSGCERDIRQAPYPRMRRGIIIGQRVHRVKVSFCEDVSCGRTDRLDGRQGVDGGEALWGLEHLPDIAIAGDHPLVEKRANERRAALCADPVLSSTTLQQTATIKVLTVTMSRAPVRWWNPRRCVDIAVSFSRFVLDARATTRVQPPWAPPETFHLLRRVDAGDPRRSPQLRLVGHSPLLAVLAGRPEEAHTLAERTLALTRQCQERGHEAYALRLLGDIAARRDPPHVEEAETRFRQALALSEDLGMRPLVAHCRLGLGTLCATMGWREKARSQLSTAIELYRAMEMTF